MITQLTVRKAHIAEAARLGTLAHKAWERDLMGFFTDGGNWRRQMATDLVLYCIGAAGDIVVADRQGEVIGWGARERNYIPYLWVTPGWQGRGTGSPGFGACACRWLPAGEQAPRTSRSRDPAHRPHRRWRGSELGCIGMNSDLGRLRYAPWG